MTHEGSALGGAIAAVTAMGTGYAWVRVPSVHGDPLPLWLLTPPVLALFAGLGAGSSLPAMIEARGRAMARLGWAVAVCLLAGVGATVVGASAGEARLGRSTVVLSGLVFGGSVVLGRGAPLIAAVPLVVLLTQVHAVRDLTPERLWNALSPLQTGAVLICWWVAILAYARWGD